MSADSKLVSYVFWVKNYTHMENKVNKRVTIHHQAGSNSPQKIAQMFNGERKASSNYAIANDGTISQMVKESDKAWTSGGQATKYVRYPGKGGENDAQAVTIEVANSKGAPTWEISAEAWKSLIKLCADICIRNNIKPSYTGDNNGTFTLHNFYAATACPGRYIQDHMPQIVEEVKAEIQRQKSAGVTTTTPATATPAVLYKVQTGAFTREANARKQSAALYKANIQNVVKKEGKFYKVQVGAYRVKSNAEEMLQNVKKLGFKDAYIKEEPV